MQARKVFEKFTEDSDPIHDMGIGMIKPIKEWLKKHHIKDYKINDDLTIDVNGIIELSKSGFSGNFPEYIQFNKIIGAFYCSKNEEMTTLRGCPKIVTGDFSCTQTSITSLEYGPTYVGDHYFCHNCDELKSLKGVKTIKETLCCQYCKHIKELQIKEILKTPNVKIKKIWFSYEDKKERYYDINEKNTKESDPIHDLGKKLLSIFLNSNITKKYYNKKVKESVNEKFTQYSDPIADMNIGMMHQIKLWMESVNQPFKDKENALMYCAIYGKLDFVKLLLAAGADVHAENDGALRLASHSGHTEMVKVLLTAGADVHTGDDSALRWASDNGHTEVVKVLLAAGADVHANNDSALRWASDEGHAEVVEVLKDHIAKKKKVKESVNEKFTDNDSDPITDMGIGIFTKHDFNNEEDMLKFMVIAIPSVLKMSKIPNDIVNPATFSAQEGAFNWKYYFIIKKYVNKYIYLNGNDVDFDTDNICGHLHDILNKMGYPKTK